MKLSFNDLILTRVVLEMRNDEPNLYWDKCAATLINIKKKKPELIWLRTDTEITTLQLPENDMEVVFNYSSIRFIQSKVDNLNKFKEICKDITPIVAKELEIKNYKRVGNRYIYLFPTKNIDEAEEIVKNMPILNQSNTKTSLFGKNISKPHITFIVDGEEHKYRFELKAVQRKAPLNFYKIDPIYNPEFCLIVDVDIFSEKEILSDKFYPEEFIQKNKKKLENNLIDFISK